MTNRALLGPSVATAVALVCTIALGCSISYSSNSISDSARNSSESSGHSSDSSVASSESSSPARDKEKSKEEISRFDQDVEQYTLTFLGAGGSDEASFLSGLGDLARKHGVSDWESEPSTWEAIGRALARSQSSTAQRVAYQAAWTGGDAAKQSAVAKGISTAQ